MKNPFKKFVAPMKEKPQEKKKPEPDAGPEAQKGQNAVVDLYTGVAEKTMTVSPYVSASQLRPYNPDDLFQKTGDYSIYEDMLNDDQVSVCMKLKKDLILASGWEIAIDKNIPEMSEIKDYLETCLTELTEGPFDDMIEEVLSAFDFGFSLSEKVFKFEPDGKLALKYLRTRHPGTWLIHTDDHGKIEKYEQQVGSKNLDIDPRSLIHYVNQPKFQNPYGTSDLRTAYNAWFIKRQVIKYLAIFLEKSSSPIPVATYKKNAPKQAVTDIFEAIKSFQSKTALAIPDDIAVEFLESKSSGDAYRSSIDMFNMWIGRALFVPDLIGFQGGETGGGSYSLGRDQIKMFLKHIARRRATVERIVNLGIIRPIVIYNYGDVKKFPKWQLKPIEDSDALEFCKIWLQAVNGPKYIPTPEEVNHFRVLIKFPESDEAEAQVAQELAGNPTLDPDGMPTQEENETGEPEPETKVEEPEKKPAPDETPDDEEKRKKKVLAAEPPEVFEPLSDTNFKEIEKKLDEAEAATLKAAAPIFARLEENIAEQVNRLGADGLIHAEKWALPALLELQALLRGQFAELHKEAGEIAKDELKSKYTEFKAVGVAAQIDAEFLRILETEGAAYTDDLATTVLKKARLFALEAVKNGHPLDFIMRRLREFVVNDVEVSVTRFARTKFTEVMNRGRRAFFQASGIVTAFQFSAILDDRTTEVCAGLHGKVFDVGTEPTPPLHFNCRSLLIPITKYENPQADKEAGGKPIEVFIEETKGEGF